MERRRSDIPILKEARAEEGAIRGISQGFDNVRVLMIEGFVPPREWVHPAIRFDRYGTVAVQLDFEEPLAVRQAREGGALYWLDEFGFPSRKGLQPNCASHCFVIPRGTTCYRQRL